MPRAPRGSGSSRRPAAEADTPRATDASTRTLDAHSRGLPPKTEDSPAQSRFRIFIVDCGWNSAARRVLRENFGLIRELQKEDPIYVLGKEKSIEFMRHHSSRIGRDPIIAVHDLAAMNESGTTDYHGFRLHLGLLHTPQQALMALQNFTRFLSTHRQSVDLEADIRSGLRREGFAGAIEIVLHHEAREIGE
jgi:hypothetical protein